MDSISKLAAKGLDFSALAATKEATRLLPHLLPDLLPDYPKLEPLMVEAYEPIPYRPMQVEIAPREDIGILRSMAALLEELRDDQVRRGIEQDRKGEIQIEVLTKQANLAETQGLVLAGILADQRGQKWNRRFTLMAVSLGTAVGVILLLYASGLLRPLGAH